METALGHLRARLAGFKAEDIPRAMPAYIAARLGEKVGKPPKAGEDTRRTVARASVNIEIAVMRRALNLAVRQGFLAVRHDMPGLRLRNARRGFLEPDVMDGILRILPAHLRPLIEFLALTGWRKSEALGLQWRSVDFAGGVVRLSPDETKGGESRVFPFRGHPRLLALLEGQRERVRLIERERARIVASVFPKPDGEPIRDFYAAWRTACRAAGAPGAIPHDLRRTAARAMERAGVSRSVSMRLLGHRTASIFERYAITTESDLSDGVARLVAQGAAEVAEERKR